MNEFQWGTIKYFKSSENFGRPDKMNYLLLVLLDNLRGFIGRPITIHCGYEDRGNSSYHCRGMAVDCHADMDLIDFYISASRFDFGGIGIYPWWRSPGLHLDVRTAPMRALWGSIGPGEYVALDHEFLQRK